jgi:hypothetical protein
MKIGGTFDVRESARRLERDIRWLASIEQIIVEG